jgi:L,D-peptidoglycan transpeptidase YkuD (ErfK/YbiS/YcfS/YnhG family)
MKRRTARLIRVFRSPTDHRKGRLRGPGLDLPCALGRGGRGHDKREGDGLTPVGRFTVLAAYYRPDRIRRPVTRLRLVRIRTDLGWSDDPADRRYNRPVRLPASGGHERMWRDDALYDLVLDLSYNRGPIRRGRGSAIFLHSARPGFGPTEGCVAVDRHRIRDLVARIGPRTTVEIVG